MNSPEQALSEAKSAEAVNSTANAAEAIESARKAQMEQIVKESEERTLQATGAMLREAIKEAFGENKAQGRYIDVTRIPLICQNIDGIHTTLLKIDEKIDDKLVTIERFNPVEKLVYGCVTIILSAVVLALVYLVVRH